jgi:lysophospholipid acyltransferase (LPLAT)-like uncharacterized protein
MTGRPGRLSVGGRALAGLVGLLGPLFVRLLGRTWRVTIVGDGVIGRVHTSGRSAIYAFWHGQLLALEYLYRGRMIHVLSSWHRDGEMSARLMSALGFGVVRGSTSRGSARGLVGMLARAKEGFDLAITPDGPRGPAGSVGRGIFFLAEKSGSPIVPIGVAASPAKRLASWDRFLVPLPFSRVAVVFGEPIAPDASAPLDERSRALADELVRLSGAADALARGGADRPAAGTAPPPR